MKLSTYRFDTNEHAKEQYSTNRRNSTWKAEHFLCIFSGRIAAYPT